MMPNAELSPTGPFRAGDRLRWRNWSESSGWTIKEVVFDSVDDSGMAAVTWGREQWSVPLDELRLALPPCPNPAFMPPPPQPPEKAATAINVPDIPPLRDALRTAIARRAELQKSVDDAAAIVARAESTLAAARSELARIALYETDRAREIETAIRNGTAPPEDAETADKGKAQRQVDAAEAVVEKLREELREARGAAANARSDVFDSAQKVTAAVFRAEAQRVVDELTSSKLSISAESAVKFVSERLRLAEQGERWRDLAARLADGEFAADIQ